MTTLPADNTPPRLPPRPRDADFNPWVVRLPILLITGGLLFIGVLLALMMAFQASFNDRIMPGVSAFGVNLGGLSANEAADVLADQFTYDQNAVFTLREPLQTGSRQVWQFNAGDLGVNFDAEQTAAQALAVGREKNFLGNWVDQGLTWLNGSTITPVVTYDENIAAQRLAEIAAQIDQPGQEGFLRIEGTQVISQPAIIGRSLDIPATLQRLTNAISGLTTGAEVELVIREQGTSVVNIDLAAARAEAALSAPLTLATADVLGNPLGPWTISRDQIAQLLNVNLLDNGDGTSSYNVEIDMDAFTAYLETLAPGLVTPPQDGRFHFNEVTRQLEMIRPAAGGRSLNIAATIDALEEKVFSRTDRTAQMVYEYAPPRYHENVTAAELGITEMITESTTYFTGSSQNRRTNIAVAASRFDGVIIGPGEEFSFNTLLGELTEENGFVEGLVIFGGRTIAGIGGGVCQVSTTAFRAAFEGGYTIIERNSHGYRVGYYEQNGHPPGMDAAIWTPERDFRFQNDTPYHMLIETSIFPDRNALQFRLYSTNTGRVVEIEEPRVANIVPAKETIYEVNSDLQPGQYLQVDYAAEGADVNVTRTVTYPDGTSRTDNIFTHYLPWAAIFQVAPGDSRLSG